MKILVVDDDRGMQSMYELVLETARPGEIKVISASDGMEGLEKAKKHLPDLIILDGSMPIMGGIETLSHLKEDEETKDIPVFIISGNIGDKGMKTSAVDLGAEIVLYKPVLMKDLSALINRRFFA